MTTQNDSKTTTNRNASVLQGRELLGIIKPVASDGRWRSKMVAGGVHMFWERSICVPCAKCPESIKSRCPRANDDSPICQLARDYADRTARQLLELPWIAFSDLPAITEYVRCEIGLWLADREIERVGVADVSDRFLRLRHTMLMAKTRFLDMLGLSPSSRKSLGLQVVEIEPIPTVAEFLASEPSDGRKASEYGSGRDRATAGADSCGACQNCGGHSDETD